MNQLRLQHYLAVGAILFVIGMIGSSRDGT
jgi:NADH:ubiquinone oxidoreductase subunit K